MSPLVKIVLKLTAIASLALGVIGVFLPVLPTTPFLILAAALSYNSSPRLRQWLLEHPVFGTPIRDYLQRSTISISTLRKALAMLWLCLLVSALLVQKTWVSLALPAIGILVTIYLLRLKSE